MTSMSSMFCPVCWSAEIHDLDADEDEQGVMVQCGARNCKWVGEDRDLISGADIATMYEQELEDIAVRAREEDRMLEEERHDRR